MAQPQAQPLNDPAAGPPRSASGERAHPLVRSITWEIELVDGQAALPEERFEFWSKYLVVRCPREDYPGLYNQLGRLSFHLARHRCLAALQLFALATLGMEDTYVERARTRDAFLASAESYRTGRLAKAMAASVVIPALRPRLGKGVRLRGVA